jgi:hypothetical protein
MYLFIGGLLAAGVALTYALVWQRWSDENVGPGPYSYLVALAPFVCAVGAYRAIREQLTDDAQRSDGQRAERRAAKREKLAPHPVTPAHGPDTDPFRAAPRPPPVVVQARAPAVTTAAPVVAGEGAPPKLLT